MSIEPVIRIGQRVIVQESLRRDAARVASALHKVPRVLLADAGRSM